MQKIEFECELKEKGWDINMRCKKKVRGRFVVIFNLVFKRKMEKCPMR